MNSNLPKYVELMMSGYDYLMNCVLIGGNRCTVEVFYPIGA